MLARQNPFIEVIESENNDINNRSFESLCEGQSTHNLLRLSNELEIFRKKADNLYHRVRATHFLFALFRFYLQDSPEFSASGVIPESGFKYLLDRKFEQALSVFFEAIHNNAPNGALFSAIASAYHGLTFSTLAKQVRHSVKSAKGNRWMFRSGHYLEIPLHIHHQLLAKNSTHSLFPLLKETTPVRLDLTHSGWSDIFFLGMDYPEGARVINVSVDLGVYKRDKSVEPPITTYFRLIEEPLIRLTSLDLGVTKEIDSLEELFNFGNDYLSLLKAGVIASGIIPPALEGTGQPLNKVLKQLIGSNLGFEIVCQVNGIPKGSRLAVSTNLLGSIISVLMRASGQTEKLNGNLYKSERRLIASRAILGEWLGGSGGGWQDSGGIWPGIKSIEGTLAQADDPEYGISKGALLPIHRLLDKTHLSASILHELNDGIVLIHGGMAQNVGPILEMVTEKYLLRSEKEWKARKEACKIYDAIHDCLKNGTIQELGQLTMKNWEGPLKTIIPWVSNDFTEAIIQKAKDEYTDDFYGFLMLGGMSGGGMAMFCNPARKSEFQASIHRIMLESKKELEDKLPFAIDPVVYNFQVNDKGTFSEILKEDKAILPDTYYKLQIPQLVQSNSNSNHLRKAEFEFVTSKSTFNKNAHQLLQSMVSHLFQNTTAVENGTQKDWDTDAKNIKHENGFDDIAHEELRQSLLNGRIGLAQNKLPPSATLEDVGPDDVTQAGVLEKFREKGEEALQSGECAVFTLAAGVGSRWTQGSGVIKALNPFVYLHGKHRSFLDIHLSKTTKLNQTNKTPVPHIVATSYLTHTPISNAIASNYPNRPIFLSRGRTINQRLIPTVRDLKHYWEAGAHEKLDEQKQKLKEMQHLALMDWARQTGEGSDYIHNTAQQRFNPPGHWYEVPNLIKNGVLKDVLDQYPKLQTLLLHNIDTLGVSLDPAILGYHLSQKNGLTFEVMPRRINDKGGGLVKITGQIRLLEGLAQPGDYDDLKLKYYNSMSTWIDIDELLSFFGLDRDALNSPPEIIEAAIRKVAKKLPTYTTIKEVKFRWGHGQEDVYPVIQFEKLWSDMSAIPDIQSGYVCVSRYRGQQLKDVSELDAWANDGSKDYVEGLCDF